MASYSGRGAGSYGALGGTIEFFWKPDPEILARKILTLKDYLENFKPPLEASRSIARADMQRHFDTETAPDGSAWAPLSPETINTYGEHPILDLTGLMKAAATSDTAFPIDANDLYFSTAGLPFYAMFHETGRGSRHAGLYAEMRAQGLALVEGIEEISGGAMPARPFIGISTEAQDLIIEVFDAWFEGGVSGFYVHGTGTVQTLGPGGFGSGMTLGGD